MTWIYISALVFGGAFLIPMLLGAVDFDSDFEFDVDGDFDADFDTGFDTDFDGSVSADADGIGNALGDVVGSLVSFRNLVFFASFFGLSGLLFDNLLGHAVAALPLALVLGFIAALANTTLMRMLTKSEANSQVSNRDLEGKAAVVVLPMGEDRKGRIRTLVAGQTTFLVALPYAGSTGHLDVGDPVVVVEIENGTALVAPLPGLELGEEN